MIIESLDLKNYRNYDILNMNFDKNVNIIYGDNAQGKTNILESIYFCATSKSHRGSKDKDIVKFGGSFYTSFLQLIRIISVNIISILIL